MKNSELKTLVNSFTPFVSSKATLPVLANVMVERENNRLTLTGTNLDDRLVMSVENHGSDFRTTTDYANFKKILASVGTSDEIALDLVESKFQLVTPSTTFNLNTIEVEEYPPTPQKTGECLVIVDRDDLVGAIKNVSFAASTDEARPVLMNVSLIQVGDILEVAATDGFRISLVKIPAVFEGNGFRALVRAKVADQLNNIASGEICIKRIAGLVVGENMLVFAGNHETIFTREDGGQFPDYKVIIPLGEPKTRFELDLNATIKKLKSLEVISKEVAYLVKMSVNGTVKVSAKSEEIGSAEVDLEAENITGEIVIGINQRLFTDVKATTWQRVTVEMYFHNTPIKMTADNGDLFILMPMHLKQ